MSLKEIKDAVERDHPDWDSGRKLAEIRRLRKVEKTASRPATEPAQTPKTPAPDTGDTPPPISIAGAWAFLVILVGGMQLIGMAIWGDGLDQPDWYNGLHGLALVVSIRAIYGAYKRRPTGQ